jgi:hypothetical protein
MKSIISWALATSTIFAVAVNSADAASRKHPSGKWYAKAAPTKTYVRRSADGHLIDRDGWRQWHSWDNTCFRTLDYLPNEAACSGSAGF